MYTQTHTHIHISTPLRWEVMNTSSNLLPVLCVMTKHITGVCYGTISETITRTVGFAIYICPGSSLSPWIDFRARSSFFTLPLCCCPRHSAFSLCLFHTKSEHVIYIWMSGYNLLVVLLIQDYMFLFFFKDLNEVGKCSAQYSAKLWH